MHGMPASCCLSNSRKKWQMRNENAKKIVKERIAVIQKQFKNETGLVVDMPRSDGSGNSNDGNTARRFLKNADHTARITGIDLQLIERIHTFLAVLSYGREIDAIQFRKYSIETAELYVRHYSWYYMPQSLHKILIHGADVIQQFNLPIGSLSKEAQEARNKEFRKYREEFTRKSLRINADKDIMIRLLCSSDPFISCLRYKRVEKSTPLPY